MFNNYFMLSAAASIQNAYPIYPGIKDMWYKELSR